MSYKSQTRPHCLYCDKPIAKWTRSHFCNSETDPPRSMEDCQKRTNAQVVSVKYWDHGESRFFPNAPKGRFVISYTTWDGESYVDEFFCSGAHAKAFGYLAAECGVRRKAAT